MSAWTAFGRSHCMPVIKGFHQACTVAQCSKQHQNVHNLMTSSKDVESSRVPTFWNSHAVCCRSHKVENTQTNEAVNTHPLVLQVPTVCPDTVRGSNECRYAK